MNQILRPDEDISIGRKISGGYADIDEAVADDDDYIMTDHSTSPAMDFTETAWIGLSRAFRCVPYQSGTLRFRYHVDKFYDRARVYVYLYAGAQLVAQGESTGSFHPGEPYWEDVEVEIPAENIALATDWSDWKVKIDLHYAYYHRDAGENETSEVTVCNDAKLSWLEVELPPKKASGAMMGVAF